MKSRWRDDYLVQAIWKCFPLFTPPFPISPPPGVRCTACIYTLRKGASLLCTSIATANASNCHSSSFAPPRFCSLDFGQWEGVGGDSAFICTIEMR